MEMKKSEATFDPALLQARRPYRPPDVWCLMDTGAEVNEATLTHPVSVAQRYGFCEILRCLLMNGTGVQMIPIQ